MGGKEKKRNTGRQSWLLCVDFVFEIWGRRVKDKGKNRNKKEMPSSSMFPFGVCFFSSELSILYIIDYIITFLIVRNLEQYVDASSLTHIYTTFSLAFPCRKIYL